MRRVYRATEALSYGCTLPRSGAAMKCFIALVLLLWTTVSFGAPTQSALLKRFLDQSSVQYGGADDAKTLEGRLYGWAKAGASVSELKSRAAKEFGMPPGLADRLVDLVLQRGSVKWQTVSPRLVDSFISLSHEYPRNRLVLIEAGRTIDDNNFQCTDVSPYERLLAGRPDADDERVALFDQFYCLPLLTERTTLDAGSFDPYLTLAKEGDEIDNELLRLAVYRLADAKSGKNELASQEIRLKIKAKELAEELRQGRFEQAAALLKTTGDHGRSLLPLLDAGTRRAVAAALFLNGDREQANVWRRRAVSEAPVELPWNGMSTGGPKPDQTVARYELQLLDHLLGSARSEDFDFLVQRHRLDNTSETDLYWDSLWPRLYDKLVIRDDYPGLVEEAGLNALAPEQIGKTEAEAIKLCYRCAPDLIAAIHELAKEPIALQTAPNQSAAQLPAPIRTRMDAEIATPRPFWTEHPLPLSLRRPHPKIARHTADLVGLGPVRSPPRGTTPSWTKQLPAGELVRYEEDGQRIVAITASQSLDPTGELSAGGYWISISEDGGQHFKAPLYTGLRMFEPYVVVPKSKLSLIHGDHLQIEVEVRQIDDAEVMLPPIALPMKARRDDLYLDITLADLTRDTDGDGLTDLAEWAMLTNPRDRDTDHDGLPDGVDPLPQVPVHAVQDRHAAPLVAILQRLFNKSLGAIVTTSATADRPEQPYALGSGESDRYNSSRAIFVQAAPAYFSGVSLSGRMIVLDVDQMKRLSAARGLFFCMTIPHFEVSHDGNEALVVWSSGWAGGTFFLTKRNGIWHVESLGGWIT